MSEIAAPEIAEQKPLRLLSFRDLKPVKGISFTRVHIGRLVQKGAFPSPFRLSENTVVWRESDVDQWILARINAGSEIPISIRENARAAATQSARVRARVKSRHI